MFAGRTTQCSKCFKFEKRNAGINDKPSQDKVKMTTSLKLGYLFGTDQDVPLAQSRFCLVYCVFNEIFPDLDNNFDHF